MDRLTTHVGYGIALAVFLVLGLAAEAGATLLDEDIVTPGTPIVIPDDATLGAPPVIRLMTTGGGHTGADIIIIGLTNDDVPNTTGLYLDAGAAGNIRLGAVGGLATVASVAIANAQTVDLGAVTAGGSQGINLNANGPINLTGGLTTFGSPIIIQGNVVVGGPTLTLDTTGASSIGAGITITGTVNGSQAKTTILVLKAGTAGNINLQSAIGGITPLAGLTVSSANQVNLPAVTTGGAVSVQASTLNVNGAVSTGGGNATLNAGTVTLSAPINTGGGSLSGSASTVNVSTSGSIQNGADVASSGAIVNITGGTYNEDVTVFTALTTKFSGDTTLGGTLDIRNNVDLDGAATYLALNALAVTSEAKLDVNGIPVYVGGDVETTLGDWISDGRLFSTTWGASIKASYRESLDRTEVTPEPATLALLALGGLAILGRKRR